MWLVARKEKKKQKELTKHTCIECSDVLIEYEQLAAGVGMFVGLLKPQRAA